MNPYESLGENSFWATAVGRVEPLNIYGLWEPKRRLLRRHKIATYGSCFAQHIGRALQKRKYNWMQCEETPHGLSAENASNYNYGIYSSRTGNIYTASLLLQWVEWALKVSVPPEEVWEKNGRYFDPFRPNIEPDGFMSENEMLRSRELTLEAFKQSFAEANLFVFTLGLTEGWINTEGYEYPMCPGTVAGEYNKEVHHFKNHTFREIIRDIRRSVALIRTINPKVRILLTVSPVPLTATMSGNHVLTATTESKSVLRAVAGELSRSKILFDYFPSYEIITSSPFQGVFYNENKRTVRPEGVDFVMQSFFDCMDMKFKTQAKPTARTRKTSQSDNGRSNDYVVCEEELLAAFNVSDKQ